MKKKTVIASGLLLLIASVLAATQVSAQTDAAAEAAKNKPVEGYVLTPSDFKVGDTIYLSKDSLRYMTGQRMSDWVYGVPHVIRQLGGPTRPNGVLVAGINSWVYPATALPVHPRYETQAQADAKAAAKAAQDSALAAETVVVEPEPVDTVVPVKEQPIPEPVVMDTVVSQEPKTPVDHTPDTKIYRRIFGPSDKKITMRDRYISSSESSVNRLSLGVRVGAASFIPSGLDYDLGYSANFDLQYAHYWTLAPKQCRLGFLLGVGVGYMQGSITNYVDSKFDISDGEGRMVNYAVKGYVQELNRELQLSVPVMFSMIAPNGFYLNVGPTFMVPVLATYRETVTDPNITMTYLGVPVSNEEVTGRLENGYQISGANAYNRYRLNVLLGVDLGYDFLFSNGNSLGLGAYFNYGVYSSYKPISTADDAHAADVIHITPAGGEEFAKVEVQPLMGTTNRIGYYDFGVKVAYHFNFWK